MIMRLIELVIDEENELNGVDAVSIVGSPATDENWIALKSEEPYKFELAQVSADKRLVMGVILVPNKPIYRKNKNIGEHHIFFSDETVRKCMELFLKNNHQSKTTLEHKEALSGITLVESWIVEDLVHDKTALYKLNAPLNSWAGTFKVENEEIWQDYVKTGVVKGFSIEGFFAEKQQVKMSADELEEVEAEEKLNEIKKIIENGTA